MARLPTLTDSTPISPVLEARVTLPMGPPDGGTPVLNCLECQARSAEQNPAVGFCACPVCTGLMSVSIRQAMFVEKRSVEDAQIAQEITEIKQRTVES